MLNRILLLATLATAPMALYAHHSVALNFTQDEITLDGTITSLRYINPHGSFVLAVEKDDGTTEEWVVELLAKIALERQGFDFDALQEGMEVQLRGRLGYKEFTLRFEEAITADGRSIVERSPLNNRFRAEDDDE
ncbi:MAG: DUF6152 family protein [Candidatus Rariloculaceae bacterium]